jgi:hypothetical protein
MPRRHRLAASAALFAGLFLAPQPARAGDDPIIVMAFGVSTAAVAIPALVTIPGNAVMLARDEKPGLGWPIAGLVSGAVNLGLGVAFVATSPQGSGKPWWPQVGFGAVNLALGAADVVLSALVLAKRAKHGERATLVPLPLTDARGRMAGGLGFQGAF